MVLFQIILYSFHFAQFPLQSDHIPHPHNGAHPTITPPSHHRQTHTLLALHLPKILHLPPLLHPPAEPANPPLPTPQVVPPDPALLPPPPHLQTVPARRAGHALVQECGTEEAVGFGGCGGGGGLDDEGRGREEGRVAG